MKEETAPFGMDYSEVPQQAEEVLTVYIAGPMRGYDHYNFPAFYEAAETLRELGYKVLSPAEHDIDEGFDTEASLEDNGFDLQAALRWDLAAVCASDAVVVLPGWRESSGVAHEVAVAEATGRPVLEYPSLLPITDEPVSAEACRLVAGPRQGSYGHPADDFTRTGALWGAILGIPTVPPHLVGLCQVALKISREVNAHKRDNLVDIAGYAETVNLVEQRVARK
jgi:hypothetical protein